MTFTNDQYLGLSKLDDWYQKYSHQCITINTHVGTGIWELLEEFIAISRLKEYEIAYLSYNQKSVVELGLYGYHAYYIDRFIYDYVRITDFDTLPLFSDNPRAVSDYTWERYRKHKIPKRYKLLIVFDASLLSESTLYDLMKFNVPIILVYDSILLENIECPFHKKKANISLRDISPYYATNPLVIFAYKSLANERFKVGSYDSVNVINKKNINLYNLKSSNMNLTITDTTMNNTNQLYRTEIQKNKTGTNRLGDRLILSKSLPDKVLSNDKESKLKIYMTRGVVGKITKLNRHVATTKYLPIEFTVDFYKVPFTDIRLDRHYLNKIDFVNRQIVPEDIAYFNYAFALSVMKARSNYWDKVTLLVDDNEYNSKELQRRLLYSAICKAKKSITIAI